MVAWAWRTDDLAEDIGALSRLIQYLYLSYLPIDTGRTSGKRPSTADRTS